MNYFSDDLGWDDKQSKADYLVGRETCMAEKE
jgi:hypothetical protein